MKTAIVHPSIPAVPLHPANDDAQIAAELDEIGRRAAAGDRKAIGAIAVKLRPRLLAEARAVLGSRFKHEAEDVVQDFFVALLERQSRFLPAQGHAMQWMCGLVRAMARNARGDRKREWGIDDEP